MSASARMLRKAGGPWHVRKTGCVFDILLQVMWLLTTPAMVYLLSLVSDFSSAEVGVGLAC